MYYKIITMSVNIPSYSNIIDYILYAAHSITHLFYNWKFVPLISLTYFIHPPIPCPLTTTSFVSFIYESVFMFCLFIWFVISHVSEII